jgi:hypothetical protein
MVSVQNDSYENWNGVFLSAHFITNTSNDTGTSNNVKIGFHHTICSPTQDRGIIYL